LEITGLGFSENRNFHPQKTRLGFFNSVKVTGFSSIDIKKSPVIQIAFDFNSKGGDYFLKFIPKSSKLLPSNKQSPAGDPVECHLLKLMN